SAGVWRFWSLCFRQAIVQATPASLKSFEFHAAFPGTKHPLPLRRRPAPLGTRRAAGRDPCRYLALPEPDQAANQKPLRSDTSAALQSLKRSARNADGLGYLGQRDQAGEKFGLPDAALYADRFGGARRISQAVGRRGKGRGSVHGSRLSLGRRGPCYVECER